MYALLKNATKNTVLSLPYKGTCIPTQVSRPSLEGIALRVSLLNSTFKSMSSLILRRSLSCEGLMVVLNLSDNAVNFVCIAERIQITQRKNIRSTLESIKLAKVIGEPMICKFKPFYYSIACQIILKMLKK